jgi:hypothetical protein
VFYYIYISVAVGILTHSFLKSDNKCNSLDKMKNERTNKDKQKKVSSKVATILRCPDHSFPTGGPRIPRYLQAMPKGSANLVECRLSFYDAIFLWGLRLFPSSFFTSTLE